MIADKNSKRIKKFNNGNNAILCNICFGIIKQGLEITREDWESTEPIICKYCEEELKDTIDNYE